MSFVVVGLVIAGFFLLGVVFLWGFCGFFVSFFVLFFVLCLGGCFI